MVAFACLALSLQNPQASQSLATHHACTAWMSYACIGPVRCKSVLLIAESVSSTSLYLICLFNSHEVQCLKIPGHLQDFERTLKDWMTLFNFYLTYDNPALASSDVDKETSVDAVKAAVCQNINLFIALNEEEFDAFLNTFATAVWTELTKVSTRPGQVQLLCNRQALCLQALWTSHRH